MQHWITICLLKLKGLQRKQTGFCYVSRLLDDFASAGLCLYLSADCVHLSKYHFALYNATEQQHSQPSAMDIVVIGCPSCLDNGSLTKFRHFFFNFIRIFLSWQFIQLSFMETRICFEKQLIYLLIRWAVICILHQIRNLNLLQKN